MTRDVASTPFRVWRCVLQMQGKHAEQGHVIEPYGIYITCIKSQLMRKK
jgi:hypothetical protein